MRRTRPRLLVLTQYYRPEPNFITADVAEALAADFDVTVVTAHPNYPFGRFYGERRHWRPTRSVEQGITIWRVPFFPDHGRSLGRRGASYASFALAAGVTAALVAGRPDLVWVYQSPFTVALAALWFKWLFRARVIYTYADLWPESLVATDVAQSGPFVNLLFAYRRWINRRADEIIVSTRGTGRRYAADGIDPAVVHYVPVWVDGVGDVGTAAAPPAEPEPSLVYAGNLGPAQALESLVLAAPKLQSHGLRVDFYGTGSCEAELRRLAVEVGVTNVRFHGRVDPAQAFEVSSRAFAQVVSLRPSPLFAVTVPSKLAFCFAAGTPILYGLQGEAATLAAESGGGVPFTPGDAGSLVAAVEKLLSASASEREQIRRRLRRYYEEYFARSTLLERYRTILGAAARLVRDSAGTRRTVDGGAAG
jgi:glycosyltransferase involved in cell wall biosynthesis